MGGGLAYTSSLGKSKGSQGWEQPASSREYQGWPSMWTCLSQASPCTRLPQSTGLRATLPLCSWCLCVADSLGGGSEGPCFCPTPCNLTRYGKEISMVRIPNRGSARYLARKYNRNETYIRYVPAYGLGWGWGQGGGSLNRPVHGRDWEWAAFLL